MKLKDRFEGQVHLEAWALPFGISIGEYGIDLVFLCFSLSINIEVPPLGYNVFFAAVLLVVSLHTNILFFWILLAIAAGCVPITFKMWRKKNG
jgi:hypothetical protein